MRDCALLMQVICGQDSCDVTSVALPLPIDVPTAESLAGIRLGVPSELLAQGVEPGVRAAFDATLRAAEGLGQAWWKRRFRTPDTPCRPTT